MSRCQPALAAFTALIIAIPASSTPLCDDQAECLYELAAGSGPFRMEAAERLRALTVEHPEDPWYPISLGRLKGQSADPKELKQAEALYTRGIQLAIRRRMPEAEFDGRWGLCRILRHSGRFEEEKAQVELAAAVARASNLPKLRLRSDILRALHWNAEGEFERSWQILEPLKASVVAERSYPRLREYLLPLAAAAQETARFPEALGIYRHLAEAAAAASDTSRVVLARYGMAVVRWYEAVEVPSAAGREEVLRLGRSALEAAQASGRPSTEALPLWLLGTVEDASAARRHLERCFEVASSPNERSFCRGTLALRLAATDPREADRASLEALELAKESGSVHAQTAAWSHRMRVSWEANGPERALQDAHAALDAIEALRNQQKGGAGQPGLFSTWAEHYYWLSGEFLRTGETERAFEVIERMRSRTLIDTLGLSLSAAPDFASLAEIRAALAPDEALLSFQIAPWKDLAGDFGGGSWLLVSIRGGTRLHRLPDRTELRSPVSIFTGLFESRDGSEAEGAASLFRKLLAPALVELPSGVRRLVIVADDALHRLPFAVLRPGPGPAPLVARYEITQAPSATLWLHWRRHRTSATAGALVLANPVTDQKELPYALTEGKAVKRHLGDAKLFVEEEATEALLKGGERPFGLLHFAAHAKADDVHPERSAIYLSDGKLEALEIAELDLEGRIVVLSTCESAAGGILRGEGVMGLARAFFQAGAHTVVASLWKLRDDDGAALFDRFYRYLGEGKTVAAALRAAQLDRIKEGAPAVAWAGVVVLGNGDRVPLPGGRRPRLLPWALLLGFLALLLGIMLRLRLNSEHNARKRRSLA